MKLLILGGTGFLGRHLVEAALERQHSVTLFNRGQMHPELFPEVEQIHGDRKRGLQELRGRNWDAVIDSNGQLPRHVRESASLLAKRCEHYTFISTVSVYSDYSAIAINESSPIARLNDIENEEPDPELYGGRKALCEQYAEEAMPNRTLIIRPGLIVGPYDHTDRFTYWPQRIARGGKVLAPGKPEAPVQFIDVRDLAEWNIALVEARQSGIYNAKGPADLLTMGHLLEQCRKVSDSDAIFEWVSEAFLMRHEVAPYTEMPLWVPSEMIGFSRVDCQKALAAGLKYRPLVKTIQDTLAWHAMRSSDYTLRAGLAHERERELLRAWRQEAGRS